MEEINTPLSTYPTYGVPDLRRAKAPTRRANWGVFPR